MPPIPGDRSKAAVLAKQLTQLFLEAGKFALTSGPTSLSASLPSAASASSSEGIFSIGEPAAFERGYLGFSGLSIQSVGYTKGPKQEEVDIYVVSGSKKHLHDL